jgi:glutamyl-tRNA synthetase
VHFSEGQGIGGDFGPYRQSERKNIYKKYVDILLSNGSAYYAFDTPEELDLMRKRLQEEKAPNQQYNAITRNSMKNSFTLSDDEIKAKIDSGKAFVIRFKMPENLELKFQDIIRGEISVNTSTLDDKVLFKSDGLPTYHLANVVDDFLMKISHVIRGEEWLPSLPLHTLLYSAFGWENEMPEFAHLPLLLKPNGKGKLSKRDGDKGGFPVFPLEWKTQSGEVFSGFKESGYFDDAFINMLAFLGWNPGTEQEIFSMEELEKVFSLEKVGKSGAKFSLEKAKWYNHQYIQNKSDDSLAELFHTELEEKGISCEKSLLTKIIGLIKDRVDFANELWKQTHFFFEPPKEFDKKVVKKKWKENTPVIISDLKNHLSEIEDFTSENIEKTTKNWMEQKQLGMGQVMNAFRLTIVGSNSGPHLFDIIEILGKKETLKRIEFALGNI